MCRIVNSPKDVTFLKLAHHIMKFSNYVLNMNVLIASTKCLNIVYELRAFMRKLLKLLNLMHLLYDIYTVNHKKRGSIFLTITLANLN